MGIEWSLPQGRYLSFVSSWLDWDLDLFSSVAEPAAKGDIRYVEEGPEKVHLVELSGAVVAKSVLFYHLSYCHIGKGSENEEWNEENSESGVSLPLRLIEEFVETSAHKASDTPG